MTTCYPRLNIHVIKFSAYYSKKVINREAGAVAALAEWSSWRNTQPSTNATTSHWWPLRWQALLGQRLSRSWENWVLFSNRSPGKPSRSPTCGNACSSQCNGKMPLQWWEHWGAPPSLLISFLDCLFLPGALSASPLTDCHLFSHHNSGNIMSIFNVQLT